jgi:hypothetical protein
MRRRTVRHYTPLPNGGTGCWICGALATWWADFAHNGAPPFLSTAYCDHHGHNELRDTSATERDIL